MLKKLLLLLALSVGVVRAYDPASVPNNRVGVHILDPNEINDAAKLINSSGGDWGYVTIPIRSNDRDRDKWLKFFQNARRLHVIPIIRLATYPNSDVWVEPNSADLIDFANFLNDMPWPTNNRYLILFNEPNHANEWGGNLNPYNYATLFNRCSPHIQGSLIRFFSHFSGTGHVFPQFVHIYGCPPVLSPYGCLAAALEVCAGWFCSPCLP